MIQLNNNEIFSALNPLFPDRIGKKEKLEELCRYELFARRLLEDSALRQDFIDWVFVCENEMKPFIQFPDTVRKIVACGLSGRIGFFGGNALRIMDGQLTLPFEGVHVSIMDENSVVTFRNNYSLTIKQIFRIFRDRLLEMGNLEFFSSGICNWNPKKLGAYNPATGNYDIDYLKLEDWWEWFPWIEQLTVEQSCERYQEHCDGSQWIFTVKASREQPTMAPSGTHSYLEVAIPNGWGYNIYYFGKFATTQFPQTTLQTLNCITSVMPAAVCYPDENIFNFHREHIGHSALATPEEAKNIMRSIRKDISNAMNGNLYFQLINENCCKWVWKKLHHHLGEERIPNLFSMSFIDVEMGFIKRFKKMSPKKQKALMSLLFFLSGGWRKRTVVKKNGSIRKIGIFHDAAWKPEATFLHPPKLFENKIKL
jgi:hypothetical protein